MALIFGAPMKKVMSSLMLVTCLLASEARAENGVVVIDASGADGYYSGSDGSRGGTIKLHLSYTDATKTVVALTGSKTVGNKTTPISQQIAVKDLKSIVTRARGGDGANGSSGSSGSDGRDGSDGYNGSDGSSGSNGSDGCPPGNGSNGSNGSDGSDGSNGTDGYDGGDGENGGDGANGGSVLVSTAPDQSELMLFVQVDVRRGEGAYGGSGGSGGRGGRGGTGGRGGRGGSGGSGGRNTCTNDKGEHIGGPDGSSGWSGSDGRNGSDGRSGSNGRDGSSGYNGSDGKSGTRSFQLVGTDGTQSFDSPFKLEIGSVAFIDDDEDGILEPGERAHLVAIQLKNSGPMPSPSAQTINLALLPSTTLFAPGPLVTSFPQIAAGALSEVLRFRKGQLMMQAPNRQSLVGEKAAAGVQFAINSVRTGGSLDTGMAIGWPVAVSGSATKVSGNFSVPQQLSFTLQNKSNLELGPRGSKRFEVALEWASKTIPASDVYVALADGRVFNLASPVEIRDLSVPARSTTPLSLQLLVRNGKLVASGAGMLTVLLKLQGFSSPDEESLQKLPVAVNFTLDLAAIPWAQEIQLRDVKITCDFYKLAKPAKQRITSIMVQKAKGSNQITVKVGAAALLSPAMVIPATAMLPYYEQFQGKWAPQLAVDFLNKMASPGSPKNGPWAFKGCVIVP